MKTTAATVAVQPSSPRAQAMNRRSAPPEGWFVDTGKSVVRPAALEGKAREPSLLKLCEQTGNHRIAVYCGFLFCIMLRYLVTLHSYSGMASAPMYGDYEAQRHWMEITVGTPLGDWYRDTPVNDLQYWGLDYPPLTAYVSWAFGTLAQFIEPEMVALTESRGYESPSSKVFMRLSVLFIDALVYFPAVWAVLYQLNGDRDGDGGGENDVCSCSCRGGDSDSDGGDDGLAHVKQATKQRRDTSSTWPARVRMALLVLMQPAIILIDHGHFQYNTCCLGLVLWGVAAIISGREFLGSVLFCLALNFKQMALYYAPAFFCFLLARCWQRRRQENPAIGVFMLGVAVIGTFAAMWGPFCLYAPPATTCGEQLGQILHRMFPFARGLFEDKVANIWFAVSVVVKLRDIFSVRTLGLMSTGATLLLLAPSAVDLLRRRPTPKRFVLALFNSSLSFFLCSFQVHEKSLLMALVPASLFLTEEPLLCGWFGVLGCFSMWPLLRRDGLAIPYGVCIALFLAGVAYVGRDNASILRRNQHWAKQVFVFTSYTGMLILHVAELVVPPPEKLPHLFPVLVSLYSCANLCVAWLWATHRQWTLVEKFETADGRGGTSHLHAD